MDFWVVIPLFLVVVVVVGYVLWQLEKKRREALAAFARQEGFRFSVEKRRSPDYPFSLFDQGHSRYSRYHMKKRVEEATAGLDSCEMELFEYHYAETTGSGKNRHTHHYHHLCAYVEPGLDLGSVMIRKEGWGDKLVQAIGFDDIDFEDHEFSKKFVVKAKDRKEAYDLLDRRMMSFLLENRRWKIETAGGGLLVQERSRPNPERCAALAGFVLGFLAEIPRVLVNEERTRQGLSPVLEAGNVARFHRKDEEESES